MFFVLVIYIFIILLGGFDISNNRHCLCNSRQSYQSHILKDNQTDVQQRNDKLAPISLKTSLRK